MIFNTSLDDGIDPQDWKMANVTPVFTGVTFAIFQSWGSIPSSRDVLNIIAKGSDISYATFF